MPSTETEALLARQRKLERQQNRRKYILLTLALGALLTKLVIWWLENG